MGPAKINIFGVYKRRIRLILFDLDGTLVDSSVDITNALNHAIIPKGIERLRVEDTIRLVGEGVTMLVEKVLGPERMYLREDVLERFLAYYSEHLIDNTTTYPDVMETLERLGGYTKAVISNKREFLSRKTIEELNMARFFQYVIGSDSTPEKKPSPVPILTVLDKAGIMPEEAMMVGDSNLDIEAGRRAGIITVGVGYGYRPVEMLRDADFIIEKNISEILGILKMVDIE